MDMVAIKEFGKLSDGREVTAITLSDGTLTACLLDYGARVQSLVFDGVDTVLGYDSAEAYEACTTYQGAAIGRFANRIADGRFTLGGVEYDVGRNSGGGAVHLHGGDVGFDRAIWSYSVNDGTSPSVEFSHTSPDGDMGYPGTLSATVRYTVSNGALQIEYNAVSDKDTVISLTNHCYFNLDGNGDILGQYLTVNSHKITPLDEKCVPTGEFMDTDGTEFDFTSEKQIGRDIDKSHPQLIIGGGYDHNFVISESGFRFAARARSEKSGITLECCTDRPGLQLYTSNFLGDDSAPGKNGKPLFRRQAFCLETQGFPDAPNKPGFPSAVLKKGEQWSSKTVYSFSKN